MTIKVLVNGSMGRMGQITVKAIAGNPQLSLVGETSRGFNLAQAIKDSGAQVVVDFTSPQSVFENAKIIIAAKARPVIGTSGLTAEQIAILTAQCAKDKLGGLIVPNFSLGAVLMMKYAAEIIKYFPQAEIIEMHHDAKKDSPSGTAILSAQLLAKSRKVRPTRLAVNEEVLPGARGANFEDIPIHSIRLSGLLAHQQILFGGNGETLSLRHDTISRDCFMPGVCLACEKVMTLDHMVYGLADVL